jgi:hypothetical protein
LVLFKSYENFDILKLNDRVKEKVRNKERERERETEKGRKGNKEIGI